MEIELNSKIKPGAKTKVEIELDILRKIAKYYQFPVAIFFASELEFKGTRELKIRKDILEFKFAFDKLINELLEKL